MYNLSTLVRQQLDFVVIQRCEATQKSVLLITGLEGHLRLGSLVQELDTHCEPRHIHGILASTYPTIVVPVQFTITYNGTADASLCHQPHRPHGHLLRVAHL